MMIPSPQITNFPIFNFASRAVVMGFEEGSLAPLLASASSGDADQVRERLHDQTLFVQ